MLAYNHFIMPLYQVDSNQEITLEIVAEYFNWQNHYGDDITGGGLTPMFRYSNDYGDFKLYASIGIGGTYADQIKWGNRDLGDNWMFVDTLELGGDWNKTHRLSISLKHYSNAGFNKQNDGVNIFLLNYGYFW